MRLFENEHVFHHVGDKAAVKGRETTGRLYTLVSKMITTSHERDNLMSEEIGDTDFFFFSPKMSGGRGWWAELDGSGQGEESLDAVYNAVSIVLRGQSLLFRLRCLSFRDTKHATSSCTRVMDVV